jgi:hypothetical protein
MFDRVLRARGRWPDVRAQNGVTIMQIFKSGNHGEKQYFELFTTIVVLATVLLLWAWIA